MNPFFVDNKILLLILFLWTLPWKAYALWTAVKRNEKVWFVVFIIVNTFGIFEIIYLFWIAKKKWSEVRRAFLKAISIPSRKQG